MRLLPILTSGPYNLAFAAAIVTGLALAYRAGQRGKIPTLSWNLLLAVTVTAAIVGSKTIFLDFDSIAPGEKTNLGGIILGLLAAAATAWTLGISARRTLDALTIPALCAMAIGRIGCFFAGCCAGTSTTFAWGIRDADGHLVHPVQLLEAGGDLLLVLWLRSRRIERAPGARVLAGAAGYALLRFGTEFLRADRTAVAGLNLVQWSLLVLLLVIGALARRTRTATPERVDSSFSPDSPPHLALMLAVAVATLTLVGANWFVPLEQAVLLLAAGAIAGSALRVACEKALPSWGRRLRPFTLAPRIGAMLLLQTPAPEPPSTEFVISSAVMRGTYHQFLSMQQVSADCDGNPVYGATGAGRESQAVLTSAGVRQRLNSGSEISLDALYLSGRDLVRDRPEGAPAENPVLPIRLAGYGGAFTFESDSARLRLIMLGGTLSRAGIHSRGPAVGANARFIRNGLYVEANYTERDFFATLGDFSYVGLGYQTRRRGIRGMIGTGQGAAVDFTIPIQNWEAEVKYRSAKTTKLGLSPGNGLSVGLRTAIRIR